MGPLTPRTLSPARRRALAWTPEKTAAEPPAGMGLAVHAPILADLVEGRAGGLQERMRSRGGEDTVARPGRRSRAYGLATVMVVPLLSPSGSVLALAS
jgi:hypothetical protein